jgi:hypothetical protein
MSETKNEPSLRLGYMPRQGCGIVTFSASLLDCETFDILHVLLTALECCIASAFVTPRCSSETRRVGGHLDSFSGRYSTMEFQNAIHDV